MNVRNAGQTRAAVTVLKQTGGTMVCKDAPTARAIVKLWGGILSVGRCRDVDVYLVTFEREVVGTTESDAIPSGRTSLPSP